MDPNKIRVLTSTDLINRFGRTDMLPIHVHKDFYKKLKTNLIIPSANQAYSMCIEYMSKWFYDKFPEGFFRGTFLEASNIMDQLRSLDNKHLSGTMRPASSISADLDLSYNREAIDLHNLGMTLYSNHCSFRDAFFIDRKKHLFISLTTELLLMNFQFRVKVDTRSLQLDVAKMCQMAFRANGTQKHYNDVDYPIPKELINQIASDSGHVITNNNIYDRTEFLHYLNSHSKLAFSYKLNTATQNMEWFIKVPNVIIHINTGDVNIDQGNMKGMTNTDYQVTFDAQVRFPSPKFYAYYSIIERESIKSIIKIDDGLFIQRSTNMARIPEIDEHGWQWTVHTDYQFNSPQELSIIKKKQLGLKIGFKELIGDLRDVIDYTKSIALTPELFLDIKVFNYDKIVKTHIDWQTYTIHIDQPVESSKCFLIIYMDNAYVHDKIAEIRHYKDNSRIQPSNNRIGNESKIETITTQASSTLTNLD